MEPRPSRWAVNLMRLNRRQTNALLIGIVVFVCFSLIPPWNHVYVNEVGARRIVHGGHGGIANPPRPLNTYNYYATRIDIVRLGIYWLVVAGITYAVVIGMADRSQESKRLLRRYERD